MSQFVIVERYTKSCLFWENLLKKRKHPELSLENLLLKYQGFEGEIKGFFPISDNIDQVYQLVRESDNNILLMIQNIDEFSSCNLADFQFIGYDYGVCKEEKTVYSSIFNEVLFGSHPDLVNFNDKLNEYLLCSNQQSVEAYAKLHQDLFRAGEDVEEDSGMMAYKVWRGLLD